MKKILYILLSIAIFSGCTKAYRASYLPDSDIRKQIISDAKHYLGVPYKYGGTSPTGFDCSGFTQYIYRRNGIELPRTVTEMQNTFKRVKNPRIGDIVVFSNPKHVGILIGGNKFIHASVSKGIIISKLSESWYRVRVEGYYSYFM